MGIFDKLRGELVDIVEWVDDGQHTLVWRFPRYHNQIKNGANLIVRPGQKAIFVHRGTIADVFEPGHYVLETANLPVLSTLMGWPHGFDSPFKAEVYFVSTRQIPDLKWGTPNPVMMRDPDFGVVRVQAFGTYVLRAVDPETLLKELVGTDASFETDEVTTLLRSVISSAFADLVASSQIAVLDLASNYQSLSEKLRERVIERIDDEYGLDIPQLYIVNISLPEAVERALDARTGMNAVGDLRAFQAYQLGQAIPVAAANPAGGLAGAGLGVGMGMALAQQGMGAVPATPQTPASPAAPAPPVAPPPLPAAVWHVAEGGRTLGPLSEAQLAALVPAGRLRAETLVWSPALSGWTPAGSVAPLAGLFASAPPPLPPDRS